MANPWIYPYPWHGHMTHGGSDKGSCQKYPQVTCREHYRDDGGDGGGREDDGDNLEDVDESPSVEFRVTT